MTAFPSPLPALETLLPHAAPMLLLDVLRAHGADWVHCRVTPREGQIFTRDGAVPAAVALEYMAQAVGVLAGLRHRSVGEEPRVGYLIGCRQMVLRVDAFELGEPLDVHARCVWEDARTGQFSCSVQRGDACLADATLTVHDPPAKGKPGP